MDSDAPDEKTPSSAAVPADELKEEEVDEREEEEEEEQAEEKEEEEEEKEVVAVKEAEVKRKRGRGRGRKKKVEDGEKAEEKEEKVVKRRRRRSVVPATPALERPSRERKTVERYSAQTPRSGSAKKAVSIVQGSGTKLKDIPNVSFKLSKRKPDENLNSLHTILYGRKSNAHNLKRNISQFSGFVWTDNQEKQRARMKEKLDKFNKEKLLDFCEILDIHVLKVTTKKEEVSAKLLEFLESPCITRDLILSDKEKGKKRGRRSKGSSQTNLEDASEGPKKKRKREKQTIDTEKENNDDDEAGPADSEDASMGDEEDEDLENENNHAGSDQELEEDEPEEPAAEEKLSDEKQVKEEAGSVVKEMDPPAKKTSGKSSASKAVTKDKEENEPDTELDSKKGSSKKLNKKVSKSSSKERDAPVDSSKASKKSSRSKKEDGKEGQSNNTGALNSKVGKKDGAKASGKNKGKGKASGDAGAGPTREELHAVVSDILKEVDFNTATLADILRQLGAHFKMDLMDRKAEVKRIIEDVINSMSDDEEGGDGDDAQDAEEDADVDLDGGKDK